VRTSDQSRGLQQEDLVDNARGTARRNSETVESEFLRLRRLSPIAETSYTSETCISGYGSRNATSRSSVSQILLRSYPSLQDGIGDFIQTLFNFLADLKYPAQIPLLRSLHSAFDVEP
jgi:hypothetical protein